MKISVINNNTNLRRFITSKLPFKNNKPQTSNQNQINNLNTYYSQMISKISFTSIQKQNPVYELNLSMEELEQRTNPDYLRTITCLNEESEEYKNLAQGDKEALKHLAKAAVYATTIFLQQDNENNISFDNFLKNEIEKGNKKAELTKTLFDAQVGINALDRNSQKIILAKGIEEKPGKGFYPSDLTKEEFHKILKEMLEAELIDEVKNILNQRTIVIRNNNALKAIDYTKAFKHEFNCIADELDKASKKSTNEEFNKYLRLQAKALRTNDEQLDAYADMQWATLQDTPLEFTISREQYADEMTETVLEDEELKKMLDKYGITPISKDSIGIRVGIVNKKGTENLQKVKAFLPVMAENMPLNNLYKQNINNSTEVKQTMVDVDIVALTGDCGSCRSGITLAQNLPNNDKLAVQQGGGHRNVYHKQVRNCRNEKAIQEKLNLILNPNLHKYYNTEADHWFTVGHENVHTLGPKTGTENLGRNKSIIEENKADMGSIALLDCMTKGGIYTEEQKKEIIVTFCTDLFLKAKPERSQAHRVRSVMQANYLTNEGAININKDGIIDINIDKVIPAAKKMLTEIISIQLAQDFNKGEEFVNKYFIWTDKMDLIADKIKLNDKTLNEAISMPFLKSLS